MTCTFIERGLPTRALGCSQQGHDIFSDFDQRRIRTTQKSRFLNQWESNRLRNTKLAISRTEFIDKHNLTISYDRQ